MRAPAMLSALAGALMLAGCGSGDEATGLQTVAEARALQVGTAAAEAPPACWA